MRNRWYGDNRDLVKWGVLLHVALKHGAERILHVAYLRPSQWGELEIDGELHPLSQAVIEHFRDVRNIMALTNAPRIQVMTDTFDDRDRYIGKVVEAIRTRSDGETCVVFLDPDTGLEPQRSRMDHVLESEVTEIWGKMFCRDVLVCYQHQTNRAGEPWIDKKLQQFERALGLPRGAGKVAHGAAIARDVALFYSQKVPPKPLPPR